jgi:hypothetical protein
MNPFKRFGRAPAALPAGDARPWITTDLQRYYMDGFLDCAFTTGPVHAQLVALLRELQEQGPRGGYRWEEKYAHTKDLRPSAGDYDASVIDVLGESDVPGLLHRATGLQLWLAHVQIRVVFPGDSYMDWHRDTHYYGGKLTGSIPPMHKIIFYPAFGTPAPQLQISAGSHRRVMTDERRDRQQASETAPRTVSSADDRFLLFETSLLHAVVPERRPEGSLRVIYAFGQESQLAPFEGSRRVQERYRRLVESA